MRTQEELKELFDYDPESGKLFWKFRSRDTFPTEHGYKVFNGNFAGKEAGCLDPDGGLKIGLLKKQYKVHRIIWALVHGEWPEQIDHVDGNRSNNKISNLRSVTAKENSRNKKISPKNTSGAMGVYWHKDHKHWQARIKVDGKLLHLGYFIDINDAIAARKLAEDKYNFHPNHGRIPVK